MDMDHYVRDNSDIEEVMELRDEIRNLRDENAALKTRMALLEQLLAHKDEIKPREPSPKPPKNRWLARIPEYDDMRREEVEREQLRVYREARRRKEFDRNRVYIIGSRPL